MHPAHWCLGVGLFVIFFLCLGLATGVIVP